AALALALELVDAFAAHVDECRLAGGLRGDGEVGERGCGHDAQRREQDVALHGYSLLVCRANVHPNDQRAALSPTTDGICPGRLVSWRPVPAPGGRRR